MRTWIIGSGADCDIVVARPTVSGRHCRLTETADGYVIEDLGSANGTYVNGVRIASATCVSASDSVTLGLTSPMPWPEITPTPGATVIRIGRKPDNDIVFDDARVSGHHARLIAMGDQTHIEDLGSSNGTFVNSPDRRVTQPISLSASDIVYFGSLAIPAVQLLTAQTAPEKAALPPVAPPRPVPESAPVRPTKPPERDSRWASLLLAQAPILAILIVLISGRQSAATITEANWTPIAQVIASTTFALAVASIWLGGSLAAWASVAGRSAGPGERTIEARLLGSPAARLATLAVLCIAQCALLLAIVYRGIGLRGDWPAMLGVLVMASAAGLLLGLSAFSLSRNPAIAGGALLLIFIPMIALGGWIRPLPALGSVAGPIAAAMPSRWAFEGLLLIESERRPLPEERAASEPIRDADLAEDFFPAASERMGPRADATALGSMLLALTAAAVFISGRSQAAR